MKVHCKSLAVNNVEPGDIFLLVEIPSDFPLR